jgi:hypothetical protein
MKTIDALASRAALNQLPADPKEDAYRRVTRTYFQTGFKEGYEAAVKRLRETAVQPHCTPEDRIGKTHPCFVCAGQQLVLHKAQSLLTQQEDYG